MPKQVIELELPWWDHAVAISLAREYFDIRTKEKELIGFRVFADAYEIIHDDGWGE